MSTITRQCLAVASISLVVLLRTIGTASADSIPVLDQPDAVSPQLEPIKTAYQAGNVELSIDEAKHLMDTLPRGELAETVAFLLGDLSAASTGAEEPAHVRDIIAAYQHALQLYPDSPDAPRALWRLGKGYATLNLYYESIASYKRLLKKYPSGPYASPARLGIGLTYSQWKKWDEAASAYQRAVASADSPDIRTPSLYGMADALYHLDQFQRAFSVYETLEATDASNFPQNASALFQYGDAAFQLHKYPKAHAVLMTFYNLHPSDQRASLALVHVVEALRRTGDAQRADVVSRFLSTQYPGSPGEHIMTAFQLTDRVGSTEECDTVIPAARPMFCQSRSPDDRPHQGFADDLARQIAALVQNEEMQPVLLPMLHELSERLRNAGEIEASLAIMTSLQQQARSKNERERTTAVLRTRLDEAVAAWQKHPDKDINIVRLFHTYSRLFTPAMLTGATGLAIADSHARLELFAQAVDLYEPIAFGNSPALAEQALAGLGAASLHKGEAQKAQRTFERFLKRYPKSPQASEIQRQLADALIAQDQPARAVPLLTEWLARHPTDPNALNVSLRLAEAYQRTGQWQPAIALYQKWLRPDQPASAGLTLRLADALFQAHDFHRAADLYRTMLTRPSGDEDADWIRLQLARSWLASGRTDQARESLNILAAQGKSDVIRELASQMTRSL